MLRHFCQSPTIFTMTALVKLEKTGFYKELKMLEKKQDKYWSTQIMMFSHPIDKEVLVFFW